MIENPSERLFFIVLHCGGRSDSLSPLEVTWIFWYWHVITGLQITLLSFQEVYNVDWNHKSPFNCSHVGVARILDIKMWKMVSQLLNKWRSRIIPTGDSHDDQQSCFFLSDSLWASQLIHRQHPRGHSGRQHQWPLWHSWRGNTPWWNKDDVGGQIVKM